MDTQFMPSKDRSYRIQVLEDNCERKEPYTYRKQLDDTDLAVRKDEVVQKLFEISREEIAKKEMAAEYNDRIKALKKQRDENLQEIAMSSIEVREDVYLIADHDEKKMGYYNADGDLVYSRPLTQDERQGRVKFLNQASNQ